MSKVLLVNDCRFESTIMKDMLETMGHEVIISDEYKVMEDFGDFNPEILICNFIMKQTTGDLLINEIKRKRPSIKGILSSSSNIDLTLYKSKGVDEVIKTPIDKEKLNIIVGKGEPSKENVIKDKRKLSFCPYCGEKLNNTFKFCPYCGEEL